MDVFQAYFGFSFAGFQAGKKGIFCRYTVCLRVYDISGRLVQVLEDSEIEAGRHTAVWDGRDREGRSVASGVYFCRLEAGEVTDTRAMVLLK